MLSNFISHNYDFLFYNVTYFNRKTTFTYSKKMCDTGMLTRQLKSYSTEIEAIIVLYFIQDTVIHH